MGRPRKATNVLDLKGAFKKDPQRKRPDEPIPEGEFKTEPPEHFSDEEIAMWNELIKQAPAGVLTSADMFGFEVFVTLAVEFRVKGADMLAANMTRMCTLMGKFGLDPSGRASLIVVKPKKKNDFE